MLTSKRSRYRQENIVSAEVGIFTMKATREGFISRSTFFMGSLCLLMFAEGCMAAPVCAPQFIRNMKIEIRANTVVLSKLVGETQADFAQIRLGDRNYDDYPHRIPGLPQAIWHQDRIPEQTLLKKIVEELFIFRGFFRQIKDHEVQKKSNFVTQFQNINDKFIIVISSFQQLEMCLGYTATHQTTTPQPSSKPARTPKQQDKWALGVQKELLYWLIPVQGELNRQINSS